MEGAKENCLARVNFSGGIIGLIAGSQFGRIETIVNRMNSEGWNLAEVIPENRNLIVWILRVILLVLTLGLWTLSTGYILVFERPRTTGVSAKTNGGRVMTGRIEPVLSSGEP